MGTDAKGPRGLRDDESKIVGKEACLRIFRGRPQAIVRVYVLQSHAKLWRDLIKWCVDHRLAYHVVSSKELEAISGSIHHEGICLVAKARPGVSLRQALASGKAGPFLWLDGVQNPQNLGAAIRTAAHFGVPYVLSDSPYCDRLPPSAARVAEGGAESVDLVRIADSRAALEELKAAGYLTLATSSHKGQSLYQFRFPEKSVLILGSEAEGISKSLAEGAEQILCIPGSGKVESLNVGVAAGLCLGEYWRQHHARPKHPRPFPGRRPFPRHRGPKPPGFGKPGASTGQAPRPSQAVSGPPPTEG